jgi:uncharacterized membrane protein
MQASKYPYKYSSLEGCDDTPFSKKTTRILITSLWIVVGAPVMFVLASIISYHLGYVSEPPIVYSFTLKAIAIDIYCLFVILNIIYLMVTGYRDWVLDKQIEQNEETDRELYNSDIF